MASVQRTGFWLLASGFQLRVFNFALSADQHRQQLCRRVCKEFLTPSVIAAGHAEKGMVNVDYKVSSAGYQAEAAAVCQHSLAFWAARS